MIPGQIYPNATNAMQNDPELKELLQRTIDAAIADNTPFGINQLAGIGPQVEASTPQPPAMTAQQLEALRNQRSNTAGKSGNLAALVAAQQPNAGAKGGLQLPFGPGSPVSSQPITPADLAQIDNAPIVGAPMPPPAAPPQVSAGAPQRGSRGVPGGNVPQIQEPGFGSTMAAFLSGLGTSDAVLPAIGGGMAAVQQLERQTAAKNQTLRALMARGVDADTAMAAVSNPEILKAVLPRVFGGKMQLGEVYDEEGRKRSVMYDEYGNMQPIGGSAPSKLDEGLRQQALKDVENNRGLARDAELTLTRLNQLEKARENFGWEGFPFADWIARAYGLTNMGGEGEDIRSLAANIQLQFTQQTKGAISDREMAMFASATPGLGMTDQGAARVIPAMKAGARRVIERNKFYQQWMTNNRGNLTGADEAWDKYVNENPVIYQDNQGALQINERNLQNWRNYLPGGPGLEGGTVPSDPGVSQASQAAGQATPQRAPSNTLVAPKNRSSMTPMEAGEARPGMYQAANGDWYWPNPQTGRHEKWEPPQ